MDQYWQDTGEAWQSMAYRWKDKHDELAELVRASLLYEDANDEMYYLEGGESYLDLDPPKARRNFIRDWECIDKALRKAVEG
jgi:hypothetical protein